jgi:hypothetical protein
MKLRLPAGKLLTPPAAVASFPPVQKVGTARCAVRTPQRGVPTEGTFSDAKKN